MEAETRVVTRTETGTEIGIENVTGIVAGKEFKEILELVQVNTLKIVLHTTLSKL